MAHSASRALIDCARQNGFERRVDKRMGSENNTIGFLRVGIALALAVLTAWQPTTAHEIRPAVVTASFSATTYRIEWQANIEAVLAGIGAQHSDTDQSPHALYYNELRALPAEALVQRIRAAAPELLAAIHVEFDGRRVSPRLDAVDVPPPGDARISRLSRLVLRGAMPPGARTFRWRYPAAYGNNVLRIVHPASGEVTAAWLKEGAISEPFPLQGAAPAATRGDVVARYAVLGFTHIVPHGLDHILFVLGLFLLSARRRPLLIQVTAFTVAHTITLGLSIYGVVALSPAIVEPLIAASIVYVAVENIVTTELKPWRPLAVFAFGLLHGLGFAGVLADIGLPRAEFVTALMAFNVGVELGQLAVLACAWMAIGWWARERVWYRRRAVIPLSTAIAAIGLYWAAERLLGSG